MDEKRPSKFALLTAYALLYVIWGSTYLAIRFSVQSIPPVLTGGLRFFTAGVILLVICALRGVRKPTAEGWRHAVRASLLPFVTCYALLTVAEVRVPSSIAALIMAFEPLWYCIFGWLFFHGARPQPRHYAAIAVGVVGAYFIISSDPGSGGRFGAGQLFWLLVVLCSSFSWVLGAFVSKDSKIHEDASMTSGMMMLCGGIMLIALQFVISLCTGSWPQIYSFSRQSLWAILYLAVFGSVIAYTSFLWLMRVEPASRVSTYAFVNPVMAVFLGWLLAGEQIHRNMLIATPLVVVSVILMIWKPKGKDENSAA